MLFDPLKGDLVYMNPRTNRRKLTLALRAALLAATWMMMLAAPAHAASADLTPVIDSIRNWIAGLLAAPATLVLPIGGPRRLVANGNPRASDERKE